MNEEAANKKIKKLFREFDHKNFYIDFCDLYGFNYHNGITFSVFGDNSKECFIRGGRYNFIGKEFGKERPAVIGDTEEAYRQNRRAVTVIR